MHTFAVLQALVLAVRGFLNQGLDYWDVRDQVLDICYQIVNNSELNSQYEILCPGVCDNYGPHVSIIDIILADTIVRFAHHVYVHVHNTER